MGVIEGILGNKVTEWINLHFGETAMLLFVVVIVCAWLIWTFRTGQPANAATATGGGGGSATGGQAIGNQVNLILPGATIPPSVPLPPRASSDGDEHRPPEMLLMEWRDGGEHDMRPEYRKSASVVFRFGGNKKQRGRAYIDLRRNKIEDRLNAEIASQSYHEHSYPGLIPGTQYQLSVHAISE